MTCCPLYDNRYGCVHEICPGCYLHKGHDQNVCDQCHDYAIRVNVTSYIEVYGKENIRASDHSG